MAPKADRPTRRDDAARALSGSGALAEGLTRRIDAGVSGAHPPTDLPDWDELALEPPWPAVLAALRAGASPRPVQLEAFARPGLIDDNDNVIISAPTNSGKTIVGLVLLLRAVRDGRRAVLLEPLRAVAREKAEELEAMAPMLGEVLSRSLSIRLSTGDYRLEDEELASSPPESGEIIVATPERLEAILRNPRNDAWASSIGAVCVDEAHLIGSAHRGPTLEFLVTSLLCMPTLPRVVFLSATLGNLDRAREWLDPCQVVSVADRCPPLHKEVLALAPEADASEAVVSLATEALADSAASLLVFVYQTKSAEKLARDLTGRLGPLAGEAGALAYHSRMSSAERESVRVAYDVGKSRCIVSTTALALGVNLPATHVVVRDTTFQGEGRLGSDEILQMLGRAGRSEREGHGVAVVRAADGWDPEELADALRREEVPSLVSPFERAENERERGGAPLGAMQVAAQLARRSETGATLDELRSFFARSLGGRFFAGRAEDALRWLSSPTRALAFKDDFGRYHLTVLGLRATRAVLPLEAAAGLAQLVRDILSVDPSDALLARWGHLDHLITLDLLSERAPRLRAFSEQLAVQVDGWMEAHTTKIPLLYREWIAGRKDFSKADEVLGSLGVRPSRREADFKERARRMAYLAVFRAIVAYELGQGRRIEDLERQWRLTGLAGIEERWRDNLLWMLSGESRILEIRSFFFHLTENCKAEAPRIRRVKGLLRQMQRQTFDLQEELKYLSPLGPVARAIRRGPATAKRARIGTATLKRLEETGISSFMELASLSVEDLVRLGVRRDLARQICSYVRRRQQ